MPASAWFGSTLVTKSREASARARSAKYKFNLALLASAGSVGAGVAFNIVTALLLDSRATVQSFLAASIPAFFAASSGALIAALYLSTALAFRAIVLLVNNAGAPG